MTASRHKTHHGQSITLLWHSALTAETKVFIGEQELSRLSLIIGQLNLGKKLLLLTQPSLSAERLQMVVGNLEAAGLSVSHMSVADGEAGKSSACLLEIWDRLQLLQFSRRDTILALGGGALSDIAGFAASTYLRGINLILVPTTLLAQVDAAIGGKTAINLPTGKNLAGSFYFAKAIIIDTALLETLPRREFISGLSEVIKYALIESTIANESEYQPGPRPMLAFLEECLNENFDYKHPSLTGMVTSCIKMKLAVVAKDPLEKDLRRCLNLGHTLGHAIEIASDFALSHGEAVAIGMVFVFDLSAKKKKIDQDQVTRLKTLLKKAGLPVSIPSRLSSKQLSDVMFQDKKRDGKSIKMILPEGPLGSVNYRCEIDTSELEALITKFATSV